MLNEPGMYNVQVSRVVVELCVKKNQESIVSSIFSVADSGFEKGGRIKERSHYEIKSTIRLVSK